MIGRLNHVAIAVPDLDAAIAQYRDTLGASVGRPQDEAALRGPVEATGAQFRFARYGGSGGPVLEAV